MIRSDILIQAFQTLITRISDKLSLDGETPCPVYRDGETPGNSSSGMLVWDLTSPLSPENASEPFTDPVASPSLSVWAYAESSTRRAVLEEAILDILTPFDENNRRKPWAGQIAVGTDSAVWFHGVFHTDTVTLPGSKQGQSGPESPGLQLTFTCHVQVFEELP